MRYAKRQVLMLLDPYQWLEAREREGKRQREYPVRYNSDSREMASLDDVSSGIADLTSRHFSFSPIYDPCLHEEISQRRREVEIWSIVKFYLYLSRKCPQWGTTDVGEIAECHVIDASSISEKIIWNPDKVQETKCRTKERSKRKFRGAVAREK